MSKLDHLEVSRSQVEQAIHEWIIGKDAERNRKIVSRRLFDGIAFERLAEEFELSDKQTRIICKKCEDIIFRHIPG